MVDLIENCFVLQKKMATPQEKTNTANAAATTTTATTSSKDLPATFALPPNLVRNLSDKVKEKRKLAGEEIEILVKKMLQNHEEQNIRKLIVSLQRQFCENVQPTMRKVCFYNMFIFK